MKNKKFKFRSNLWSGIIMGLFSLFLLITLPNEIRVPTYDSGAPSPRIIPGVCIVIMLVFSIVLIIQSLVFKKDKVIEFDWEKEKPVILMILMMCLYVALIIWIGFIFASIITFLILLLYCGERKPLIYIIVALAAVGIYFLFKNVFYITLPALFL